MTCTLHHLLLLNFQSPDIVSSFIPLIFIFLENLSDHWNWNFVLITPLNFITPTHITQTALHWPWCVRHTASFYDNLTNYVCRKKIKYSSLSKFCCFYFLLTFSFLSWGAVFDYSRILYYVPFADLYFPPCSHKFLILCGWKSFCLCHSNLRTGKEILKKFWTLLILFPDPKSTLNSTVSNNSLSHLSIYLYNSSTMGMMWYKVTF